MVHTSIWSVALLSLTVLFAGCSASTAPEAGSGAAAATADPATDTGAEPAGNVEVEILSFDEIQARLADKRGKVVVMDAWSTSCPPCMKDFHNLVELHKQYPAEDVACVSLSFDYEGLGTPEEARGPVLEFLRSQGAEFDNLMSNEESDVLYRKFQLNAVPAVFVYDRAGKLRERFESEGAYEKVRTLVAELIEEPDDAAAPPEAAEPDGADPAAASETE